MNNELWIVKFWRPTIAWVYIIINIFDFIIAPLINFHFFGKFGGSYTQWNPLTLMGAGTFHLAFGAILGVTAWSRGKEKLIGAHVQSNSIGGTYYNGNKIPKKEDEIL